MNESLHPEAPEDFEKDINELIARLKTALGEGDSRWYYDDHSEILYIELESLAGASDETIEKQAGPILDSSELDFEEIILLPLTR
ncbi:hypothetical protein QA596_07550 [Balneolales bacterium ANBcel1]|nr:hypothetical protein [Balneolales bacterium ANBcel1]